MGTKARDAREEAYRRIDACRRHSKPSLDLSGLGLTSFPDALQWLKHLEHLFLGENNLTYLPDGICDLPKLKALSLSYNHGLILPACLGRLSTLRQLYLAGLSLRSVPPVIRELEMLTDLNLAYNNLTSLPDWLQDLSLRGLAVAGNDRLNIPAEIASTVDAETILDYYFRSSSSALPLNEFKLVLVGRGGVGKTSLVHRLVTGNYKTFDRTPGVHITKWPLTIDGDAVRAHVWDFGGQEIMHGTHRFFMTERAVYLVLLSGREGMEDHDAEYWLSLIRSFAGEEVPVIVLLHKYSDYPLELNRELLRDKYGRHIDFLQTDSSTGYQIDELKAAIRWQASSLSGLKAKWPTEWRKVKEDLPASQKNWLTFDDFRAFCKDRGVPERKDQELLAEALHALGLMLSYQHDEALRKFGVLNPQWVTEGIYRMLNAPALRAAGGEFTVRSFAKVLPANDYPKQLHPYLLGLMRKFRLCHPLDEKGSRYLIPELLTKEEPPNLEKEFVPEDCLGFIYRYDAVLPEGLLSRFIVDTYVHREPALAWRTGVVLAHRGCRALVRGDVQGRRVTIRVAGFGTGKRELLGIIREHFERIHNSYEKLPVTEVVPIPGHPESVVKHDLLLKYERAGRTEIAVEIGDDLKDFDVRTLLDGVDITRQRRMEAIPVFISYSQKDSAYYDQLVGALTPYERMNELRVWGDQLIEAGESWEDKIATNLDRARIVILLLSDYFMQSDYAMEKEVPVAMKRHDAAQCEVVPVVVRPTRWEKVFGSIKAVVPGGKAISQHRDKHAAWNEFTKQLDDVIERVRTR